MMMTESVVSYRQEKPMLLKNKHAMNYDAFIDKHFRGESCRQSKMRVALRRGVKTFIA